MQRAFSSTCAISPILKHEWNWDLRITPLRSGVLPWERWNDSVSPTWVHRKGLPGFLTAKLFLLNILVEFAEEEAISMRSESMSFSACGCLRCGTQ